MLSYKSFHAKTKASPSKWRNEEEWKAYVIRKYSPENANQFVVKKHYIEDLKASISKIMNKSSTKNTPVKGLSSTHSAFKIRKDELNASDSRISIDHKEENLYSGIIEKIKGNISRPTTCKSSENRYRTVRKSLDERFRREMPRSNSLRKTSCSSKTREKLNYLESKIADIKEKFSKASYSQIRESKNDQPSVSDYKEKMKKSESVKLKFDDNYSITKRKEIDESIKEKLRQLKQLSHSSKERNSSTYKIPPSEKKPKVSSWKEVNPISFEEKPFLYYYSHIINALYSEKPPAFPPLNLLKEHFHVSFQVLSTAKKILTMPRVQELKSIHLPEISKPTLVLDMDETLLHCATGSIEGADTVVDLKIPGSEPCKISVFLRPFLYDALETLSQYFELVVFTASHATYANLVLDFVDSSRKYLKYRIFRDYCVLANDGMFVKDLRILVNRPLENTLIVDNSAHCFAFQPENGVPVVPFYFDRNDEELPKLTEYLTSLFHSETQSVRDENNKRLSMSKYSNYGSATDFLEGEFGDFIRN